MSEYVVRDGKRTAIGTQPDFLDRFKSTRSCPTGARGQKRKERIEGPFYQLSVPWADRAAIVCGRYHILAIRLYRCWRTRGPGEDTIAVTTDALSGPGYSRDGKHRVVAVLARAGLIEIVEQRPGRAPRVRVMDPQLVS
jgi:hypothetical protein